MVLIFGLIWFLDFCVDSHRLFGVFIFYFWLLYVEMEQG